MFWLNALWNELSDKNYFILYQIKTINKIWHDNAYTIKYNLIVPTQKTLHEFDIAWIWKCWQSVWLFSRVSNTKRSIIIITHTPVSLLSPTICHSKLKLLQKIVYLKFNDHCKYLHMPWHLRCHGMCKFLWWSIHYILDKRTITSHLNFRMENYQWNGRSFTTNINTGSDG